MMDALARQFAATHDMKVKEGIDLLAREYGKLKEPWVFVARSWEFCEKYRLIIHSPQFLTTLSIFVQL
jgi:hypothetical protein